MLPGQRVTPGGGGPLLALATRAYFANELTAGIEEAAARTATVVQRLVEDLREKN